MGRIGWIAGLVVALVVGFGAGWLAFGSGGGADDRARACASAEELPETLELDDDVDADRIELLNKIAAVGMLAIASGQEGDELDDLDEVGRAGQELRNVVERFETDQYDDARQALLDAC